MKKSVLIVEDDPDIAIIIDLILQEAGYYTMTCTNGVQMDELVEQNHPSVVLMDVQLGMDDGRVLCRHIKEAHSDIVVILMSAHDELRYFYQTAHADSFIAKPFDINALVKTVDTHFKLAS